VPAHGARSAPQRYLDDEQGDGDGEHAIRQRQDPAETLTGRFVTFVTQQPSICGLARLSSGALRCAAGPCRHVRSLPGRGSCDGSPLPVNKMPKPGIPEQGRASRFVICLYDCLRALCCR